ncbi:Hypothetical predicted protein [Prunus dulcis]|uniref:RNase H type-1 domain-containing protein n=1 Tax=Prunus dulcis TaxID=3755 RepID=A0A5E4F9M6_PRUDU|nr:Hypothetical predicted protein [Prunus dulcis]
MPVGGGCESDRLVWPFSVSGCYSVKTGYKLIHPCYHPNHRHTRASGSHCVSKKVWKQIWCSPLTPKIKNFIWLAVKGCLPTKAILFRRHLGSSPLCPVREKKPKTIKHLLLYCIWTSSVWFGSLLCYRVDMHSITTFDEWLLGATSKLDKTNSNWVVDTIQRWLPPSQATLKLNVDATWDKKTLIAGLRAVIRDEHGNFIRGAGKVRLASSSVEAEAQAALYGLVVASDLGNVHLECEFDSRELILSVKGNIQKGRWTIYPFLAALKEKCRIFGSCSWKWIPRKANKAADAAAIEAKRKMCDEVWISRPPSSLSGSDARLLDGVLVVIVLAGVFVVFSLGWSSLGGFSSYCEELLGSL